MRYTGWVAKQNVSVRIEPAVILRIEKAAQRENRTVSQWIALAASEAVDRERPRLRRKAAPEEGGCEAMNDPVPGGHIPAENGWVDVEPPYSENDTTALEVVWKGEGTRLVLNAEQRRQVIRALGGVTA
jgi:hypothetical protein